MAMEFWKADGHGVLEDKCPWSSEEQVVTEFWGAGDPKRLELESEGHRLAELPCHTSRVSLQFQESYVRLIFRSLKHR